jgi:hypothetical protein
VKFFDRELVEEMMEQADATMETIMSTLESWDDPDYFANKDDYKKMQKIKDRITSSQPRKWAENPPWENTSELTY